MKVYIIIDEEEEFENIKVFSNKNEAEDYMIDYVFKCYDTEVIPSKEEVRTDIRDYGYFEAIHLIEKEII